MADILLEGGTIVDGTGDAPFVGDVAIADGKIAAVGAGLRAAHFAEGKTRLVDAAGKIVAPCWVDVHTHLDAQIQWDPWATPLSGNGVGTFVFGNCGWYDTGFSPLSSGLETALSPRVWRPHSLLASPLLSALLSSAV